MKIAVNTRFLLKGKLEGIGIYTQEIFRRVVQLLPEDEFYFLFDRKWDPEFIFAGNVKPLIVSPYARHPVLWYWWFERAVPKALKENNIELFLSPDGYGSLHTSVPQIITVHDLAFEHYRQHTPFLVQNYYRYFVPEYCRKADKILAVSEFTKQDIIETYGIAPAKIEVVYNGAAIETFPDPKNIQHTLRKHGLQQAPYFLFIGAVHPRKNVTGLLKAFEHFVTAYDQPHQLLIIGRKAWMNEELNDFFQHMKHRHRILWIEHIERAQLLEITAAAFALVYPSFFEGFGIPILEAMSLGVPVICSKVSAMPEVAGNAAILVDPTSTISIAEAMQNLCSDNRLRDELIEKGKRRASSFSWDRSAEKVVGIIRSYQK